MPKESTKAQLVSRLHAAEQEMINLCNTITVRNQTIRDLSALNDRARQENVRLNDELKKHEVALHQLVELRAKDTETIHSLTQLLKQSSGLITR